MTTTTTGDPSSLKTPASLSGGDLVSRLLAATPPYLYNVPLTPHSFFFSEMLRSFVQAKTEASTSPATANPTVSRRRKRSWRDGRDRPLELTTKDRTQTAPHAAHQDKYFHQETPETRFKEIPYEDTSKSAMTYDKPDENRVDFIKQGRHFFDDSSRLFGSDQVLQQPPQDQKDFDERQKSGDLAFLGDQKKAKMDFSARNFLPGIPARPEDFQQVSKNFPMANNGMTNNSDFVPSPLWYPTYPMPQSYPGIDPLHLFIDFRVSGHIWDGKINERQLPFKGKHCSAFSVPQAKEYNRPLNLTRDEATTSKSEENIGGTNFILKNLTRTYKDIEIRNSRVEKAEAKDCESNASSKEEARASPMSSDDAGDANKDIRALIGLELVVDYVKEPKEEPIAHQSPPGSE